MAADVLTNLEGVSIEIQRHLTPPVPPDPHPNPPNKGERDDLLPSPLWGGAGGGGRDQP
jgi:hypothetical protein